MSFFSNLLNPFSSRNPLRPDNLLKDPLGLHAHDLLTDPKTGAPQQQADGSFTNPQTGYQKAMNAFLREGSPGTDGATVGSSQWNNAFNTWAGKALEINGAYDAADASGGDPMDLWSDNWNFEKVTDTVQEAEGVAAEKGLYDYAMDNYVYPDLVKDAERQKTASEILNDYEPALDAQRKLISDLLVTNPDGQTVVGSQQQAADADAVRAQLAALDEQLAKNGEALWGEYQENGRAMREEIAAIAGNLDKYSAAELAALSARIEENKAAIWGELKARENLIAQDVAGKNTALQTELGTLGTGIVNRDAAYNKALDDKSKAQFLALDQQLATMGSALSTEYAEKVNNLRNEIATLSSGLNQYTAAEREALAKRVEANFASLATEVDSKRQALQTQLGAMGTAVTEQDAAKKAALEQEIAGLTAAQAPMNEARIKGAEALASSINLGVQSERDRVTAQMAQQGYIGSDTGSDNALLRASLSGRAAAANAMSEAKVANATDERGIAQYGANQTRGLANETATNRFNLSNLGATENRTLSDYDASGRRTISDFNAGAEQGISSNDAQSRLKLTQYDADATRTLGDTFATGKRTLTDFGAAENRGIANSTATERQGIANTTADSRFDLNKYGANQQRGIDDFGVNETRTLGDRTQTQIKNLADLGAESRQNIAKEDATNRLNLGNYGAAETRAWSDKGANDVRTMKDYGAAETRGIKDAAAQRGVGYFSQDLNRRLAALSLPSAAVNEEFNLRNTVDSYGQSGLRRSLDTMNWFNIGTSSAPMTNPYITQANTTTGSALSNIGAGLIGVAGSVGNANNWWAPRPQSTGLSTEAGNAMNANNAAAVASLNHD